MFNQAFFSIIIPVYNVEKYVSACIFSILAQNYDNYEIIVVDDCSTDSSLAVCHKIAESNSKIKILTQQANIGQGAARNIACQIAKGEYIFFLDSDDIMYPGILSNLNDIILRAKSPDVIVTLPLTCNDSSKKIFDWMDKRTFDKLPINKVFAPYEVPLVYALEVSACRKIVKKDLIDNNAIKFPTGLKFEDFPYHFKLLLEAQTIYATKQHSFIYRIGQTGQTTTSRGPTRLDLYYILSETAKLLTNKNISNMVYTYFVKLAAAFSMWNLTLVDNKSRKQYMALTHQFWKSVNINNVEKQVLSKHELRFIKIFRSGFMYKIVYHNLYSYIVINSIAKKIKLVIRRLVK